MYQSFMSYTYTTVWKYISLNKNEGEDNSPSLNNDKSSSCKFRQQLLECFFSITLHRISSPLIRGGYVQHSTDSSIHG